MSDDRRAWGVVIFALYNRAGEKPQLDTVLKIPSITY